MMQKRFSKRVMTITIYGYGYLYSFFSNNFRCKLDKTIARNNATLLRSELLKFPSDGRAALFAHFLQRCSRKLGRTPSLIGAIILLLLALIHAVQSCRLFIPRLPQNQYNRPLSPAGAKKFPVNAPHSNGATFFRKNWIFATHAVFVTNPNLPAKKLILFVIGCAGRYGERVVSAVTIQRGMFDRWAKTPCSCLYRLAHFWRQFSRKHFFFFLHCNLLYGATDIVISDNRFSNTEN